VICIWADIFFGDEVAVSAGFLTHTLTSLSFLCGGFRLLFCASALVFFEPIKLA
jgi:hypothetical protein